MILFVFTNADNFCLKSLALLLSVCPIVGGGVASFAYAILARGTYLDNINNEISNCQGGGVESHGEGARGHGYQLMHPSRCIVLIMAGNW